MTKFQERVMYRNPKPIRFCKPCGGGGLLNVKWSGSKIISSEICKECGGAGGWYEKPRMRHILYKTAVMANLPTEIETFKNA